MRNSLRLFTLLIVVNLVGCGASLPTIKPYKMDIQQGNVVTSEMLLQLRPGMTKSQVQFIMGTPLLVDSFHTNRWDYFYQLRKQGKIVSQRRVILDFENDLLKRVRGDVVPKGSTAEDVAKQLDAEVSDAEKTNEPAEDKVEPIVVPIEAPDIKPVENVSGSTESTLVPADVAEPEQPASVVAVPVTIGGPKSVSGNAGTNGLEVPTATGVQQKVEKDSLPEVDVDEGVLATPATRQEKMPAPQVEENKDISAEPIKDEITTKAVLPVNDNKRVFRLDRQLDGARIRQEVGAKNSLQESSVQEVKESQSATSTSEEEPGFFERMLEKIGF